MAVRLRPDRPGYEKCIRSQREDTEMLAELRLTPVGPGIPFLRLIADLLPILSDSALQYQVHPLSTTLEGELEDILDVVRRCHDQARKRVDRVLIELSIDDRAGAEDELVQSLDHLHGISGQPLERLVRRRTR
jgi:uncharacterized protein YqgV (UPF0045/DUF77 family)